MRPKSFQKRRIKEVFNACMDNVKNEGVPKIEEEMLKRGYTKSSAENQKVTDSMTWKKCLEAINDLDVIDMFKEIVKDKSDKRARIAAGTELMKLKDRYPKQKISLGVLDERKEVFE